MSIFGKSAKDELREIDEYVKSARQFQKTVDTPRERDQLQRKIDQKLDRRSEITKRGQK